MCAGHVRQGQQTPEGDGREDWVSPSSLTAGAMRKQQELSQHQGLGFCFCGLRGV